jgi:hypothetical protein
VTRFTKLERDIMAALAWDLRHVSPDLAGQFEESLPGTRRNTGSGLFTETIVSSRRPLSAERETGLFGTVHAMVGTLPDPIAFQVELRNGRLLALHGDAYGQDTRVLDFAHVPFEQVFTVDGAGRSIEFRPVDLMPPDPQLDLHRQEDTAPPMRVVTPAASPPPQRQTPLADPVRAAVSIAGTSDLPNPVDRVSVLVAAWAVIAVTAVLAILIFRVPIIFAAIIAFWIGNAVRQPRVLAAIQRGLAAWKAARTADQV